MTQAPISLICLIVAIVLFGVAAFFSYSRTDSPWRGFFVSAGLFFYALKDLFG